MRFVHASRFDAPVTALFGFHESPDALARLIPPWDDVRVIVPPASLAVGTEVVLEVRALPVPVTVRARHVGYVPGVEFVDELQAPMLRTWRHRHRFLADGAGSILVDDITWSIGLASLDRVAAGLVVERQLRRMFVYRHEETARALGCGEPVVLTTEDADARLRAASVAP